jgi:hypothetical protein
MLDDTHVLGTVSADRMLDIVDVATIDVARLADAFAGEPL